MYANVVDTGPMARETSRYASFWRRAGAWLVDLVILIVLSLIVSLVLPDAMGGGLSNSGHVGAGTVVQNVLAWSYWIWFTARGATLGKMAVGISVIGPDGGPPGVARAIRRYIVIQGIGYVLYLVISWVAFGGETNDSERLFVGL